MAKIRNKLKGTSKGKRWPKGQSSNSNPETRKYREQAKSRFFQENLGTSSNLTTDALNKHNAIQSFVPKNAPESYQMDQSDDGSSVGLSSYKTMQSFASEWSDCSNMSYSRFLKVFRSDSALHKEMLAILAAITEVIKENNGQESPTEYYCALLTTLEQVYNSEERNEDQITAILSLLAMGIKTVPEAVLRKHFNDVSIKMVHILNDYVNRENNTIVKSIFTVLSNVLRAQELAIWQNSSTLQLFRSMLNPFCIHSKPKWRKAAQQAVAAVVRASYFSKENVSNPAADQVAEFCEQTLDTCLGGNSGSVLVSSVQAGQTMLLHVLGLMKDTICNFSKNHIKKCCESILRLMTLNYPIVTSCGLQVLHALFSAQTTVVPLKLNAQLITALYEYQPSPNDAQPTLAWLAVMQQAHVHLADVDIPTSCASLPKIFQIIVQLWLSDKPEITTSATHALEVLLKDAIGPACFTPEIAAQHKTKLEKCFNTIQLGLGYQYNTVWHQVLHVISVMFEVAGRSCSDLLLGTLKNLAELRDSYKFSYNNELEHAVGAAIRSMGPEVVLGVIPLRKENGDLNMDRSWLLPVLKENIKSSTLSYFLNGILPLALYCQRKSLQQAQLNDGIGAHSSELLYLQLWNLLPCFCNNPTDIKDNFKSIAKILGVAISEKKELRLAVMASLRKLIASAKESGNEEDLNELARFDKNYLPILFNVYTTKPIGSDEEGQRLASLNTIKVYLTISKIELNQQLFNSAIERLNSSSEDPEDSFIKESILDLIRALVPYQNLENIQLMYDECIKSLPEINSNTEQKKAYRLLEEICSSESDACKSFIKNNRKEVQKLLRKSLNTAAVSSKGARLRCFNYLIKAQPHLDADSKLLKSVLPEAVLCCNDINAKCRSIAFEVINTIGELLLQHNQMPQFVTMLISGLAGTPQVISCTVLALSSVLHNFSGTLGKENIQLILENVGILTGSATREIVTSCLGFLKVYCQVLPSPMVAASLATIMKALTEMTDDCKRHFRLKTRFLLDKLIRKYGCEAITPHIPADDTVMYKRIRNLRKLNARKKKLRDANNESDSEMDDEDFTIKAKPKSVEEILADSDSEIEIETVQPRTSNKSKKKKADAWIEEDAESIVDFTDPTVVRKISATKPDANQQLPSEKKKSKDRGFKTSADGRLIIKDDSDDSDDENAKNSKLNFNADDSDSDDDTASKAETLLLADRKRKRSESVKSGFSSASSQRPMKYKTGGVGIHRPLQSSASSVAGSEYKAKKAIGDVKKKGKFDPYAYLPLKRTTLNKRKKMKAAGQFKNIIKAAKSGALKGAKAKRNKMK